MNRRDIFKGGAGAMAAVALNGKGPGGQHPGYPPPPPSLYPGHNFTRAAAEGIASKDVDPDPISAIKSAMMSTAREEAERQERLISKEQQRLNRLASTSPAWREAMFDKYQRDKQAIWNRLDEARKFIFG